MFRPVLIILGGIALLCLLAVMSLAIGARALSPAAVADALFSYNAQSPDDIAIWQYRVPRTLLAVLCGVAFGVSGALIQATTRNPLADPGLLGVNAGAAFLVTLSIAFFGIHTVGGQMWFAFLGAILSTLVVYALGMMGRNGATPLSLLLAGVAISAILGGFTQAITLLDPVTFDSMRAWATGSISGRGLDIVATVSPFILAGLLVALSVTPSLNSIALGDDLARALGTNVLRTRLLTALSITLLCGAATAAIGPIGFIGLMTPHVVRWLLGPDQRLIVAVTALFAPTLLLGADIIGRVVLWPSELEAGIVTAFLGAPLLIALVRRNTASKL